MKFDCGLTYSEKRDALRKWHMAFAWLPVRMGSRDCRWLEYYWRRLEVSTPFGDAYGVAPFESCPCDSPPPTPAQEVQ